MAYAINIFARRYNSNDKIIFAYKIEAKNCADVYNQLSYFDKECVKLMRYNNGIDEYILQDKKKISEFSFALRRLFYSKNRFTIIPSQSSSIRNNIVAPKDILCTYMCQKGDTWWSISKKLYGDGSKAYELARYNNLDVNNLSLGLVISIPNYLGEIRMRVDRY